MENNKELKKAFLGALEECYENGIMVCTTGRVNRLLGSLTLLDQDDEISKPAVTIDILRKEILEKSFIILQDELDKKGNEFKEIYNSGSDDTSEFSMMVQQKIEIYVMNEYKDIACEGTLKNILKSNSRYISIKL